MTDSQLNPRFASLLARIGAPLLAIAAVTSHFGVPVGALSTILAAMSAAAVVTLTNHCLLEPALTRRGMGPAQPARYAALAGFNALVGVGFALAFL